MNHQQPAREPPATPHSHTSGRGNDSGAPSPAPGGSDRGALPVCEGNEMSKRTPPLTKAAHGSTRCVGCGKQFAMTPGVETVDLEATEQNRNRYGGFSGPYSATTVRRRWHVACHDDFEARNAAYRAQVEADREQMVREMCEASGIDYETLNARRETR